MLEIINGKLTFINIQNADFNLCVDFLRPDFLKRLRELGKKNLLLKAIGDKGNNILNITDATAGLGRDAFLIAHRGHHVTLIERDATIHALLSDGLQRAKQQFPDTVARMQLLHQDSLLTLPDNDIIYLDPMFPERKKSALVKKDMQTMQQILGHQADILPLLKMAITRAQQRVVLKRPKLAKVLLKPHFQLHSKTHRFDIYQHL